MISDDSLCVYCDKACKKSCSWSSDFIPVDGWTARETARGYLVIDCPEYAESKPIADINNEGAMRLAEAMASQINDDYLCGTPEMRRQIERDLREGPAGNILQLMDTEAVIQKLRRLAREKLEKQRRVEP